MCRRIAGNDADAADAAQEALITISRRIDRFDGRSQFGTWAYRVATNACLDELRRRKRRPDPGLPEHETEVAERDRLPDMAEQHALKSELDAALQALPPDYRAPVVLRDVVGMDYADIATTLDIPPGTVRSRIARGRAALRTQLSGNQSRPDERQTKRP